MTDQQVVLISITPHGLFLTVAGEHLYLAHQDFPFFTQATIEQVCQVTQPGPGWLRWDALDVDISIDSIRAPEKYPLVSRVNATSGQACDVAAVAMKRDARELPGGATVIVQQAVGQLQLLDTVALLVEAQGTPFSGEPSPVLLSPGAIGVVVELLDGMTVLVEFANLNGVAYATAFVDSSCLLRLQQGDSSAPSVTGRDGMAPLVDAKFQVERDSVIVALANAFQPPLTVALAGELRAPADQVLHPSLLVLRDSVPVAAVEVDDLGCSDFEGVDLLEGCKRVDSLLYILLVGIQPRRVLLFFRGATGWGIRKLSGPAARIELPALNIQVALADLYSQPSIANGGSISTTPGPSADVLTQGAKVALFAAICLSKASFGDFSTDDLTVGKRYDVLTVDNNEGTLQIVDESGEAYRYPQSLFEIVAAEPDGHQQQTLAGMADVRAGHTISHEAVVAWAKSLDAPSASLSKLLLRAIRQRLDVQHSLSKLAGPLANLVGQASVLRLSAEEREILSAFIGRMGYYRRSLGRLQHLLTVENPDADSSPEVEGANLFAEVMGLVENDANLLPQVKEDIANALGFLPNPDLYQPYNELTAVLEGLRQSVPYLNALHDRLAQHINAVQTSQEPGGSNPPQP